MATKQVALARKRPPVDVAAQGATRIPAFLNKLHQMVNDEKTNHLIEWSATGDTFFVYDQERFSEQVLPHWFKHKNFASFVRQLNMYGFHKIPHLQQGVLKSEAGSEHWNFVHPNFRRDQPDLLCLIQRKKSTTAADDDTVDPATTAPVAGQVLDIPCLFHGIAAIKRHQTTISAELSDLKRSNELLWQESQAARARHQKQQDTINRIVKFLAGVFGHHQGSPVHKEDVGSSPPSRAVVPRRQSRLLIEGGIAEAESPGHPVRLYRNSHFHIIARGIGITQSVVVSAAIFSRCILHYALEIPTNADFDTLIQGALSNFSPAQIQQLMNQISVPPAPEFLSSIDEQDSSLMSYQAPFDFSQLTSFPLISSPPPSASLPEKVEKTWQATEDIEQDVDAMDSKINNLFEQFQIPTHDSSIPLESIGTDHTSLPDSSDNDIFNSFLNRLGEEDAADDDNTASTAFLDEVPSPSDGTISPVNLREKPTKKRKSDVNSVPDNLVQISPKRRRER
ncbi:transcription factor Hsf1 [Roridomyces roridus]|uniref:Transcription factor Hsf1 n=1 Tax=Roridomyces roridus TaxID=1738132 RepID=A0AAD7BXD8_9AGAR|nr:transcription factor Hsf1 [Roridomyces roridus]